MTSRSSASTRLTRSAKNLSLEWTSNIKDAKAKKKFEEHVRNSVHSPAWDRLIEIIEKRIESNAKQRRAFQEYDNASWAHKQAAFNATEECLYDILKLLTIEKE